MNIPHEMLIANAGSGKTFRLTVRTITLLALGVEPGKIAALTFTRKAAGEFMAAVFLRVAAAASDSAALLALRNDTNIATLDTAQCRTILVKLTTRMHRLCMGTIDSLFGRIARSFPLETGLAGDFGVLDGTGRDAAMRDTLATLFREQGEDETRFRDFLELVRQQSRKQSERQVFDTLLTYVNDLHEKFLITPEDTTWGDEKIIWPQGCPILQAGDLTSATDNLWHAITSTHPDLGQKATDWWQTMLQEARQSTPEKNWTKTVTDFVKKIPSTDKKTARLYLPTGGAEKDRVYLNTRVDSAKNALVQALLKPKLEQLIRRSRALHSLLANFESTYHRAVRQQGLLTFGDVTSVLARQVDSPAWRATVGYRLDGQFDHWLLDEFQDTSRLQWRVLGGLVDDIVQDAEGNRSFFYVGDTKQAIYSWRGGDPRLFFEIADHYQIQRAAPLDVSYRSDSQIIEVINQVFGQLDSVAKELALPEKTVAAWREAWVKHAVAGKNADNVGYVRWQPVDKDEEEEDATAIDRAIANILLEVRPWERGWSCAVLKRSNKSVETLAAHLQTLGFPVAVEGKANPCTDNPLGVTLLAAFKWTASPADLLSRRLIECSPYANVWLETGKTLELIAAEGYAATTQSWLQQINLADEPFLSFRARDFLTAATRFDAGRQVTDDIGSFVHFIENYQRQEPEGAGVVRIMTIHQAKGLTLDMTIVSGLEDPFSEDKTTGQLALQKNPQQQDWGFLMPGSELTQADPVLLAAHEDLLAISTYGELCTAYVAMTRPRHGLYILTKKIKETSTAKTLSRLLALTLGYSDGNYELGDREWYLARENTEPTVSPSTETTPILPQPLRGTPRALSPSTLRGDAAYHSFTAARIGTEVHSALAKIEWLTNRPPELSPLLTDFLNSNEAATIFTEPHVPHQLWRERAFECLLDGKWVAGVFDRVLIYLSASSTPLAAELIDFKTTDADSASLPKRHAHQIATYQTAAAKLLGLAASKVSARIVYVSL